MSEAPRWVDEAGTAHERCKLLFDNSYAVDFDPGAFSQLNWSRFGWLFVCSRCGQIWERITLLNAALRPQAYSVEVVSCKDHFDQWNIPGSVLAGRLEALLPLLPEAVLRREFEAHLAYTEKELQREKEASNQGACAAQHLSAPEGSTEAGERAESQAAG